MFHGWQDLNCEHASSAPQLLGVGGGAVDSLYSKQSLPAPSVPGNYGVQEVAGLAIKRKSRKKGANRQTNTISFKAALLNLTSACFPGRSAKPQGVFKTTIHGNVLSCLSNLRPYLPLPGSLTFAPPPPLPRVHVAHPRAQH